MDYNQDQVKVTDQTEEEGKNQVQDEDGGSRLGSE